MSARWQRLAELRRTRDNGRVGQALDRLRIACQGTENTMPYLMDSRARLRHAGRDHRRDEGSLRHL